MSSPTSFFIPPSIPDGPSPVGNSYLSLFANCPKAWFNQYLRPVHTTDAEGKPLLATGISSLETPVAFLEGDFFHSGLEAWYLSGCRDGSDTGEYVTEAGVEAAKLKFFNRRRQFESDLDPEESWLNTQQLLLSYFDRYGPGSGSPDYPDVMVAHDGEGKPMVEREFTAPLNSQYHYTMRADLVIHHRGYLKMAEHKTSSASFLGQRLKSLHYDSQMTGQCWVLRELFPEVPINGVWGNVVVKHRSPKSKYDVAERETTTRTNFQLDNFPANALDILREIDDRRFHFIASAGVDGVEVAAQRYFPDHGTRVGRCFAYNRYCEYFSICKNPGREDQMLLNYRPRTTTELTEMKEYTG